MVNIDTVYQKVLAIANKEQRGYVTPQEFNLFADQAQKEILEQYFYDINQFGRLNGNSTKHSDMLDNLEDKVSMFKREDFTINVQGDSGDVMLDNQVQDLYRLLSVRVKYESEPIDYYADEVKLSELELYKNSPLTRPTKKRPIYARYSKGVINFGEYRDRIRIFPFPSDDQNIDSVKISYIRKPTKPEWGYIVVNEKALYDATRARNFDLHPSEETNLVIRILTLAGISIGGQLYQIGAQEDTKSTQQEKA
jgi:hypothetical protein